MKEYKLVIARDRLGQWWRKDAKGWVILGGGELRQYAEQLTDDAQRIVEERR